MPYKNIEDKRAQRRRWKAENKEKWNAQARKRYHRLKEERPEKLLQYRATRLALVDSSEAIREYVRQRNKEYYATHATQILKKNRRRRLKLTTIVGTCSEEAWKNRCALYGNSCAYCGKPNRTLHRDHVIPIARGGSGWPANLVPACQSCNSKKGINRWFPTLPKSKWAGKEF